MSEIYVGSPPPRSHARLWVATVLLTIYTGFVLVVTMWPNPQQLEFGSIANRVLRMLHNLGVPLWFGYNKLEFTANILMFVPLGFLLGLALGRKVWWLTLVLIPTFAGGIEFVQGIALDERVSTLQDVAANTIGGYLGLLLALIMRAMIYARDRTKIERELWERRAAAAEILRARAVVPSVAAVNEPDAVTRLLDPDFWNSPDAPTMKPPVQ